MSHTHARPGARGLPPDQHSLHPKDCHGVLTELVTAAGQANKGE